ncbi:MAG: antibiotic biosynthesis monooxygenase [Arenimonas sp.]
MSSDNFAKTPEPPYYAVIFSSQRRADEAGYGVTAERMVELAAEQPGYLGIETVRGNDGFGITVSYWQSQADIKAWKQNAEHSLARERGRSEWYEHFELRIALVERTYGGPTSKE